MDGAVNPVVIAQVVARSIDYAGVEGSRRAQQKWARQAFTDMQCVTARISEMHPPRIAARI
jgi:hypothetical protein